MIMSEHEIKESFLQAKAPLKQISILADLNQCKKSDIRRVLMRQGIPEKDTHAANWKPGIPEKDLHEANRGKTEDETPVIGSQDAPETVALETGKEAELQMEERLRLAAEAGKTEEAVKEEKTETAAKAGTVKTETKVETAEAGKAEAGKADAGKAEATVYLRKTAKKKTAEAKDAARMDEAILFLRERQFAIAQQISRLREMQEYLEFAIQELECAGR